MMQMKHTSSEVLKGYPRVSTIAILLFCGYVVSWYLQVGIRKPILGAVRFEFIYGALISVIAIFFTKKTNIYNSLYLYAGLLFLCMILQIPFSHDYDASVNIVFERVVKFSFMAFFMIVFIRGPTQLKFFLAAFLLACMKLGQEGLTGAITGGLMWENQGVMRLHGPTPMYGHPNSFAGNALGTLPFVIYLFPLAPQVIRIALATQALFALNVIIRTGSRTSYVGLIISLLFFTFAAKSKIKVICIIVAISLVMVPFISTQYFERFETIFTMRDKEGKSTEARLEIMRDSWHVFLNHPFGVGVGAFPAVRMKEFGRIQDTHNLYFEVATNLGIQGLIVFLLFAYKMLAVLARTRKNIADQISRLSCTTLSTNSEQDLKRRIEEHLFDLKLMEACSRAVSLFLIIRLTVGFFGMDLYEIYWWFTLGLAVVLFNMSRIAQSKTSTLVIASQEQ
jgi:putative inorganic carbon (HCO3(-)) transporter